MNGPVNKRILHAGRAGSNDSEAFTDGCQLTIHFKVETTDEQNGCEEDGGVRLLEDTRRHEPLQLLLGKQFKLEVLEAGARSMRVGEVAEFVVAPSLLSAFPTVIKTLRDSWAGVSSSSGGGGHHCCGMMMSRPGGVTLGYDDLDSLVRRPRTLKFTVELLDAQTPGSFAKQSWAMSDDERLASVRQLRAAGNEQYVDGRTAEAVASYSAAVGRLEPLMLREKPGDVEWRQLNELQLPLLLNLAQCQLALGEYYAAIEHCNSVLQHWPDSVKALYRRGRAHAMTWNLQQARADLLRAAELDEQLAKLVDQQLQQLQQRLKLKERQDRDKLQGKLFG